jgi:hypothetical protein
MTTICYCFVTVLYFFYYFYRHLAERNSQAAELADDLWSRMRQELLYNSIGSPQKNYMIDTFLFHCILKGQMEHVL